MVRLLLLSLLVSLLGGFAHAQEADGYRRVALAYETRRATWRNNENPPYTMDGTHQHTTKGMSLGFTRGIGLSQQKPLFLELGGKLVWTHGIEKTGLTIRTDYLTSSFNLCAAYRRPLFDGKVTLSAFTGPNVKFNIIGRRKETGYSGKSWTVNYLNREEDYPAKIFQIGWNAGVGVKYMRYYFGYTFQPDFNAYTKNDEGDKLRSFCHSLSVGYEF